MTNTYNPADHVYRVDGVRVPSVTQVLADVGMIDDRWFADESRERGRIVAIATALYDRGILNMDKVPEHCQPYVERWIEWCKAFPFGRENIIHIEEPMWHTELRYGGKPDRIAWAFGRRTVIEIKTGNAARWHELQTAGYKELARSGAERDARMAVYLNPDKPTKCVLHENRCDTDAWRACLCVHHWQHNRKG